MTDAQEDYSIEDLFTDKQYVQHTVRLGCGDGHHLDVTLKCLQAASTDHDLTGQIIWPGAKLLAEFLLTLPAKVTQTKLACEIGSGAGLSGLICARLCDVVLTDHNPVVLDLLQENMADNVNQHTIRCLKMDWELPEDVHRIKSLSPHAQGYDLVLGADICYGLKAVPCIFKTFAALLNRKPTALGLLAYVSRATAIDRALTSEAKQAGLHLEQLEAFKDVGGGLKGTVYAICWPGSAQEMRNSLQRRGDDLAYGIKPVMRQEQTSAAKRGETDDLDIRPEWSQWTSCSLLALTGTIVAAILLCKYSLK